MVVVSQTKDYGLLGTMSGDLQEAGRPEPDHWGANTLAASCFRKRGCSLHKERLHKFI